MDPRAQVVLLCDLCKTAPLQSHCELCNISLCTNCVSKHRSDSSIHHNVRPYHLQRKFTLEHSKCMTHPDDDCEHYCENCHIPVCSICLSSGKHEGHKLSDALEKLWFQKELLRKDLEELETKIYPQYEEIASNEQSEIAEIEATYGKLTKAADQQGEIWHTEITAIVNRQKSDIAENKNKHLAALKEHTREIVHRINEIKRVILEMKNILDTNDMSSTSSYRSRNEEFNELPPKIKVTLPSLSTPPINTDQLNELIGTLSSLSITTVRSMLAEPRLTATTDTGYTYLYSVSCLSEEEVWICGNNETMKLLDLQGKLIASMQTQSRNQPQGIAVTGNGDLVYTDYDKTLNLVKNKKIQTILTMKGWRPLNVCSTTSKDLLVIMVSDDEKQSKVVRYSDSTEKQTIQLDDQGRPLYSSDPIKYISENRNMDICVADHDAKAVVVVNQSGKLRFRYTSTEKSFKPVGIATDSQRHILTADIYNDRIHILDQDGQFLRYIQNCDLERPYGLCVDARDNLFVAECNTAKLKKIQYL